MPCRFAGAQQTNTGIDTSYFMAIDEANFDSLLNYFYMQQYIKSAGRHQNRKATDAYAEFDNIPDSVFVNRLQRLHTIVPMTYNAEVRAFIKVYVRIMSRRLDAMLSLSEYYFPLFEETLDRNMVPEELKYLSIVESALNPQATSRAGAAGLWQFMYATAKNFDLEVNSLVDERRDTYKSTVAAARYLRNLYDMYGDWQVAMAAYNCGPGNVNKAVARSGGKRTFWEIYPYLPRETRGYIPKYIAATYIMNYYHEHGMTAGQYEIPIRTDTVHLHGDVHFAVVERFTKIPIQQLRQLNPQFRADVVPASSRTYALCLPFKQSSKFIRYEDSIYRVSKDTLMKNAVVALDQQSYIYHKVKKGETWTSIAKRYGVSVGNLRRWNGKSRKSTLKVGTRLKIYVPAAQSSTDTEKRDSIAASAAPTSQQGNTDSTAAAKTTKATTAKSDSTKRQSTNTQKRQPKPVNNTSDNDSPTYHKVKNGENLTMIARKYNTSVQQLMKLNNLKNDVIRPDQRLRIK